MRQAIFFPTLSLLALSPPSRASTGLKSNRGPPSVLHEIDRLEQTNIHDRSEKFGPQNFMMKTATLQKVEKIRKFHCFWHHSTKWLLAPTFGGPNFFSSDLFILKLRSTALQNTPEICHALFYSGSNIQVKLENEISLHPKQGHFSNFYNFNYFSRFN